jgi:hypothetical protein
MWRRLLVMMLLVGAGVAIALYIRLGREPRAAAPVEFRPDASASAAERISGLERALAAQIDRSRTLEARIASLEERLRAGGESAAAAERPRRAADAAGPVALGAGQEGRADPATLRERVRERQLQRLVEAGFSRERAEWIERRLEELEVESMQARFEAQRSSARSARCARNWAMLNTSATCVAPAGPPRCRCSTCSPARPPSAPGCSRATRSSPMPVRGSSTCAN